MITAHLLNRLKIAVVINLMYLCTAVRIAIIVVETVVIDNPQWLVTSTKIGAAMPNPIFSLGTQQPDFADAPEILRMVAKIIDSKQKICGGWKIRIFYYDVPFYRIARRFYHYQSP